MTAALLIIHFAQENLITLPPGRATELFLDRGRLIETEHAEFNRLNGPKLTVDHIVLVGTDALVAVLAAGTGPDVTQASGSYFSDLADKNQWYEIGPYAKRDKVEALYLRGRTDKAE